MKRILVLHSELGVLRGGGENFTRNLFATLSRRGYAISAAFVADRTGSYAVPLPEGIRPVPLGGWWSRKPGQALISALEGRVPADSRQVRVLRRVKDALDWRGARWHDQRFVRRVRSEFRSRWGEFDAVYVHGSVQQALLASSHCPTILRLPGPVPDAEAALVREHATVCANGDVLVRLREAIGDDAAELPVGLDCDSFGPDGESARGSLGWTDEHLVLGYVGRLSMLKGADLLAESFRELSLEFHHLRLLVIGNGEEEARLNRVLAGPIDEGRVVLLPGLRSQELARWYRAMDAFVLPSRYENFSNALLEAAACGIAFIASDVGGNRIFERQAVGCLFAPGSRMDLSRRLREFVSQPEPWRSRARDTAAAIRQRFSWDATADRFEQILGSRIGWATTDPQREQTVSPRA